MKPRLLPIVLVCLIQSTFVIGSDNPPLNTKDGPQVIYNDPINTATKDVKLIFEIYQPDGKKIPPPVGVFSFQFPSVNLTVTMVDRFGNALRGVTPYTATLIYGAAADAWYLNETKFPYQVVGGATSRVISGDNKVELTVNGIRCTVTPEKFALTNVSGYSFDAKLTEPLVSPVPEQDKELP